MFTASTDILKKGVDDGIFPSFALGIGQGERVLYTCVYGNRIVTPEIKPADMDTLYDMASISKIVSTTMIALRFIETGRLGLYDTLSVFYENPRDKAEITIADLMTHTSGLHPSIRFDKHPGKVPIDLIMDSELVCKTGTAVNYSCMGYILLADILQRISGKTLDVLAREYVFEPLNMVSTCYNPVGTNVAGNRYSTEIINGIHISVDDENCRHMGGVSGNAGVYSNLLDMLNFATMLSQRGVYKGKRFISKAMFELSMRNFTPFDSEHRGLGFILKSHALSAAGDLFSEGSFGHTGFTGTSLFVDKETNLFVVLLANAIHPTLDQKLDYLRIKRLFHNCVVTEAGL